MTKEKKTEKVPEATDDLGLSDLTTTSAKDAAVPLEASLPDPVESPEAAPPVPQHKLIKGSTSVTCVECRLRLNVGPRGGVDAEVIEQFDRWAAGSATHS